VRAKGCLALIWTGVQPPGPRIGKATTETRNSRMFSRILRCSFWQRHILLSSLSPTAEEGRCDT
ncbi:hypothetical protein CSUI_000176, partial [Cystoisospora suis]